jgi:hypothetical protein
MQIRTAREFRSRVDIDEDRKRELLAVFLDELVERYLGSATKIEAVFHPDRRLRINAVGITEVDNKGIHHPSYRDMARGWM